MEKASNASFQLVFVYPKIILPQIQITTAMIPTNNPIPFARFVLITCSVSPSMYNDTLLVYFNLILIVNGNENYFHIY